MAPVSVSLALTKCRTCSSADAMETDKLIVKPRKNERLGEPPKKLSKDKDGQKKETGYIGAHIEAASEYETSPQGLGQESKTNQLAVTEKAPIEPVTRPSFFITRHNANGRIQYFDLTAVRYLGYFPQDVNRQDMLLMYHPEDLPHLLLVYEMVLATGVATRSSIYRMRAQNGNYVNLETNFSRFLYPFTKKLAFITGRHRIVGGQSHLDVFQENCMRPVYETLVMRREALILRARIINLMHQAPEDSVAVQANRNQCTITQGLCMKAQYLRDEILKLLNQEPKTSDRAKELTGLMDSLNEEEPKAGPSRELVSEVHGQDNKGYMRESVLVRGTKTQQDIESNIKSPINYEMVNYDDKLKRYFDSYLSLNHEEIMYYQMHNRQARPAASTSGDDSEVPSSSWDTQELQPFTEGVITKHTTAKERELVALHHGRRPSRSREVAALEIRQRQRQHYASFNKPHEPAQTLPLMENPDSKEKIAATESEISKTQIPHSVSARRSQLHTKWNTNLMYE